MVKEWPDQVVVDALASMFNSESVTLAKLYDDGTVTLTADNEVYSLTPPQARMLADGYEDSMKTQGRLGDLQTEEVVSRLRRYADDVEPYYDDAAAE